MSVREALAWLKLGNISNVIVEMDSHMVYNALIAQTSANSPFGMLIEDYQDLVSKLDNVSFSLVRRSANSVAHCVRIGFHVRSLYLDSYGSRFHVI